MKHCLNFLNLFLYLRIRFLLFTFFSAKLIYGFIVFLRDLGCDPLEEKKRKLTKGMPIWVALANFDLAPEVVVFLKVQF